MHKERVVQLLVMVSVCVIVFGALNLLFNSKSLQRPFMVMGKKVCDFNNVCEVGESAEYCSDCQMNLAGKLSLSSPSDGELFDGRLVVASFAVVAITIFEISILVRAK